MKLTKTETHTKCAQGPFPVIHQPARQLDQTVGRFDTRPNTSSVRILDWRANFKPQSLRTTARRWKKNAASTNGRATDSKARVSRLFASRSRSTQGHGSR